MSAPVANTGSSLKPLRMLCAVQESGLMNLQTEQQIQNAKSSVRRQLDEWSNSSRLNKHQDCQVKLRECVILGDSCVGIVTCGFPQMSCKRLVEQTTRSVSFSSFGGHKTDCHDRCILRRCSLEISRIEQSHGFSDGSSVDVSVFKSERVIVFSKAF
jgi:hypothetical protein